MHGTVDKIVPPRMHEPEKAHIVIDRADFGIAISELRIH
jgi:hypothetical protein